MMPPCWLYVSFGIPCPMCGSTRCLEAMLVGRVFEAFRLNPFFATAMAAALLIVLAGAAVGPKRIPDVLARWPSEAWVRFGYATVAALLVNWIYVLNAFSG